MRRRFATLPIGKLGAGSLLRWLVDKLVLIQKGITFLGGHDINIYCLQSILSVEPKNVFIPDFADALAIELWDTGNSGNISTLWVGFHKHRWR
mmetsp:Transcript_8948/g.8780  ORF Transcript_8948/g.8780 Transcript_8948/m.8780 type:complete len:93 (-) Transcript_8948:5-283(-)